ncbi:hypothetical protein BC830DRAFT_1141855 [Chytriomyces sp. MP71]|nr:hypothetical protein BC830DRAFT_1141855 [Chytriomyces sp. MP71]
MNISANSTDDILTFFSDQQIILYQALAWTTASLALTQMLGLLALVGWIERRDTMMSNQTSLTFKTTVLRPANTLIFLMILLHAGSGCIYYAYYIAPTAFEDVLGYAAYDVCLATLTVLMMGFTWELGKPVIQLLYPNHTLVCKSLVILFTVLQFTATALDISCYTDGSGYADTTHPAYKVMQALIVCTTLLLSTLSLFVILCYSRYLRRTREAAVTPDTRHLEVLSRYGAASAAWLLAWQCITDANTYVIANADWTQAESWTAYAMLNTLSILMPGVYLFWQLRMKWALHVVRMSELERKKSIVERARTVSGGGLKRTGSTASTSGCQSIFAMGNAGTRVVVEEGSTKQLKG